jgi:uncharacterized protein with predicted RNA binding PUA domain
MIVKGKESDSDVSSSKTRFAKAKFAMSVDYIFGRGTSKNLKFDDLCFEFSRKTGRLRYIIDSKTKEVLFSFRSNGSISPTIQGAKLLLGDNTFDHSSKRPRFVVTVLDGVSDFIAEGKTVFCKHVVSCDESLRAGEDVIVLNEKGKLLAVGKSVLACTLMKQFKRGVAVKTREGIKSRNGARSFIR